MLNFLQLATVKSQRYNRTEQSGILIYYFLFLFQPSFLLQLTASISFSTFPFFFFFPLLRCSIVFPFLKKSHHQFRFYHHWSNHIKSGFFFFPLLVRSVLCSTGVGLVHFSPFWLCFHRRFQQHIDLKGTSSPAGAWFQQLETEPKRSLIPTHPKQSLIPTTRLVLFRLWVWFYFPIVIGVGVGVWVVGLSSLVFFFPFWFASSLFYRRPLVVFVSVLVVISDCGSALWINSWLLVVCSGWVVGLFWIVFWVVEDVVVVVVAVGCLQWLLIVFDE